MPHSPSLLNSLEQRPDVPFTGQGPSTVAPPQTARVIWGVLYLDFPALVLLFAIKVSDGKGS